METLAADPTLTSNASAKAGLDDMRLLFRYLRGHGVLGRLSFDMSLARGLDYYTGIPVEAIVEASAPPGFRANPPVPPAASESAPASKPKPKKKKETADEEDEEGVKAPPSRVEA